MAHLTQAATLLPCGRLPRYRPAKSVRGKRGNRLTGLRPPPHQRLRV